MLHLSHLSAVLKKQKINWWGQDVLRLPHLMHNSCITAWEGLWDGPMVTPHPKQWSHPSELLSCIWIYSGCGWTRMQGMFEDRINVWLTCMNFWLCFRLMMSYVYLNLARPMSKCQVSNIDVALDSEFFWEILYIFGLKWRFQSPYPCPSVKCLTWVLEAKQRVEVT